MTIYRTPEDQSTSYWRLSPEAERMMVFGAIIHQKSMQRLVEEAYAANAQLDDPNVEPSAKAALRGDVVQVGERYHGDIGEEL